MKFYHSVKSQKCVATYVFLSDESLLLVMSSNTIINIAAFNKTSTCYQCMDPKIFASLIFANAFQFSQ